MLQGDFKENNVPSLHKQLCSSHKRDDPFTLKKSQGQKKIHRPVCSVWTEAKLKVSSQCTVLQRLEVKKITEYLVMKSSSLRSLKESSIWSKIY